MSIMPQASTRCVVSRRIVAFALTLAVAHTGCTVIPDFDRARRFLDRPPAPTAPTLYQGTAANLPSPEGLWAKSGELRVVPLQWEPLLVRDVGGYVIERASAAEGPYERLATVPGADATAYVDELRVPAPDESAATEPVAPVADDGSEPPPNELDGATYSYRVRAFSEAGEIAIAVSEVVSATTAAPPAPPDNQRTYSHRPRKVPISWRISDDPTVAGYRVERSPSEFGPFEPVAEITGRYETTWIDQPLGDLRVFYYRVISVNAAGGEGPPPEQAERAMTKPEPLPPIGLRVVESRLGSNQLTWEPNVEPDVAQYRVLRQRADGREEIVATLPPWSLEVLDSDVGAGETVYYNLSAFDGDGLESDASDPIAVRSEDYGLRATAAPEGVRLEWYPRADEGYTGAQVSRHGALRQRVFPPVEDAQFTDPDVEAGHSYTYSVTLLDADGSPAPRSRPVEIAIPPDWQSAPASPK